MRGVRDRRRAQAGTTLVELIVSMMIMGLALVLVVGTFSTGLLDASLAKRNTAAQAVAQYELGEVSGSLYSASAPSYSECFATEAPTAPLTLGSFRAACPPGSFTLRADVRLVSTVNGVQEWTISIVSWPAAASVGSPISTYKINR
jgi:type II secretory pathway pseudopilin PulG